MVAWINNDTETGWVGIEQSSVPEIPLSTLVFMSQQCQKKVGILNIWVKHTLKVWSAVQKRFRAVASLSRAIHIVGNIEFLPSITDNTYKRWSDRGLKIIEQLFYDNILQSFSYLQEKYGSLGHLVLSKFVDSPTAMDCWRECGMIGDHSHIFWDCPKLVPFWRGVKAEIDRILGTDLPLNPRHFILDLYSEEVCNRNHMYLLHALLMAARKMVTLNWMKPQLPTLEQWKQKLREIYGMEALTAQVQLKTDLFQQRWRPLTMYFSD